MVSLYYFVKLVSIVACPRGFPLSPMKKIVFAQLIQLMLPTSADDNLGMYLGVIIMITVLTANLLQRCLNSY